MEFPPPFFRQNSPYERSAAGAVSPTRIRSVSPLSAVASPHKLRIYAQLTGDYPAEQHDVRWSARTTRREYTTNRVTPIRARKRIHSQPRKTSAKDDEDNVPTYFSPDLLSRRYPPDVEQQLKQEQQQGPRGLPFYDPEVLLAFQQLKEKSASRANNVQAALNFDNMEEQENLTIGVTEYNTEISREYAEKKEKKMGKGSTILPEKLLSPHSKLTETLKNLTHIPPPPPRPPSFSSSFSSFHTTGGTSSAVEGGPSTTTTPTASKISIGKTPHKIVPPPPPLLPSHTHTNNPNENVVPHISHTNHYNHHIQHNHSNNNNTATASAVVLDTTPLPETNTLVITNGYPVEQQQQQHYQQQQHHHHQQQHHHHQQQQQHHQQHQQDSAVVGVVGHREQSRSPSPDTITTAFLSKLRTGYPTAVNSTISQPPTPPSPPPPPPPPPRLDTVRSQTGNTQQAQYGQTPYLMTSTQFNSMRINKQQQQGPPSPTSASVRTTTSTSSCSSSSSASLWRESSYTPIHHPPPAPPPPQLQPPVGYAQQQPATYVVPPPKVQNSTYPSTSPPNYPNILGYVPPPRSSVRNIYDEADIYT